MGCPLHAIETHECLFTTYTHFVTKATIIVDSWTSFPILLKPIPYFFICLRSFLDIQINQHENNYRTKHTTNRISNDKNNTNQNVIFLKKLYSKGRKLQAHTTFFPSMKRRALPALIEKLDSMVVMEKLARLWPQCDLLMYSFTCSACAQQKRIQIVLS